MDLEFTAQDLAFRAEARAFIAENYPKSLRGKQDEGDELAKEDFLSWHRILAAKGWIALLCTFSAVLPSACRACRVLLEGRLVIGLFRLHFHTLHKFHSVWNQFALRHARSVKPYRVH